MAGRAKTESFGFETPVEAIEAWKAATAPIGRVETVPLAEADGRVLARDVRSDRPSPPCNVTAMDGYVLRFEDLKAGRIEVAGEAKIGAGPPALPPGKAMRIFTGAPIPAEGEVVLKREDVEEHGDSIIVSDATREAAKKGLHIRFEGENLEPGATVLPAGSVAHMPEVAALAGFGAARLEVYDRLRVTVLTTGDELRRAEESDLEPWEIRNSNGPAIAALLSAAPWVRTVAVDHVRDELALLRDRLERALAESDAVVLTGGVSMGDHDHVPDAVRSVGGRVVFHKLPVRPGKPVLAAVGPEGQVIAGLPGNPVSVMVSVRRTAWPVLAHRAGQRRDHEACPSVELVESTDRTLHLWWYRPVQLVGGGRAEIVAMRGSGDFAAAARSDGFIEIPPHENGAGPWPFRSWTP